MLDIGVADFNLASLISIVFTIITGFCSLFAYRHFNKRKEKSQITSSPPEKVHRKKTANRIGLKSSAMKKNDTRGLAAQVKQRAEEIELSKLTSDERENEMRVRASQLEAILSLMRANPQKFGGVSSEDLTNQLSTFYTTATPTSYPIN